MKKNGRYFFKYKISYLFLLLSLIFWKTINAQVPASPEDCSKIVDSLQLKADQISSSLASIDSLLTLKGNAQVPVALLFQLDIKDEKAIATRITELSKLTNVSAILDQPEFKVLTPCAKIQGKLDLLQDVANKQSQLNSKKLLFFKMNELSRNTLIEASESLRQQYMGNQQIEKQLIASKKSLENAQISLTKDEEDLSSENLSNDKFSSAQSLLEKFMIDIEAEHIEFITNIKQEREMLDQLREQLTIHSKNNLEQTDINKEFLAVDDIWRFAAEGLLKSFSKTDTSSKHIKPKLFGDISSNADQNGSIEKYALLHKKASDHFEELSNQKQDLLIDLKALNFRLVTDVGRLRASLINFCKKRDNCEEIGGFNQRTITGLAMELRILPLKFIAGSLNKIVEFRQKISKGFDGWTDISRQILIFIFLFLFPFLLHKFLDSISRKLKRSREDIFSNSAIGYLNGQSPKAWIIKLNPFIPSIGMLAGLHLARKLIETTDLKELSYVFLYLEIYFIYRAVRILLKLSIEFFFSSDSLYLSDGISEKAERTARRLSRFFFARFLFLHVVEDTVRKALIYGLAYDLLFFAGLLVIFLEFKNWHNEISRAFESRFNQAWQHFASLNSSRWKILVLPFLLILVIGHDIFRLVSRQLIKFDFFKRILSEVFRKKLKQDIDPSRQSSQPAPEYLAIFDYYRPAEKQFYIDREPLMAKQILDAINNWLIDNAVEDLVILVGHRGLGKTTSAKMIYDTVNTENKLFQWIEPKMMKGADFFDWLSTLLKSPIRSIEDFIQAESLMDQKLVVIVDDIHNLFIGKIGGFDVYRLFMEIISLKTTNIFWCLTINSHAWTYLKGVFGREHFYGQICEMRLWTDIEIQNLILARHNSSGFTSSFDKSVASYSAGNILGEQVEVQFFRLLWGQSRGNPRSALMHWISAISQIDDREIHVGVPKFINSNIVSSMSNDALMILAAIAKHDSLTSEELFQVTRVNKLIIRKILRETSDNELIWTDENQRVRISSMAQSVIDYYLIGKNFLYG